MLKKYHISDFQTHAGYTASLEVTYRLFGKPLGSAPIILVNHALTGNSQVLGECGWWSFLIGPGKAINTNFFTVLAMDIPGNGHDGQYKNLILNYKAFNLHDIARIQYALINHLSIQKIFAVIGGSLGGQLAWELVVSRPNLVQHLIPIASDWKATDWVIAQCRVQDQILNNSLVPINDARLHAMTFYRTPASFKQKFGRAKTDDQREFKIESWLKHHGKRLQARFTLPAYKLMNHLLATADITASVSTLKAVLKTMKCKVHLVAINSDGLFLPNEIYDTHLALLEAGVSSSYKEIESIHGHDAFLMEYKQLNAIVKPIFENALCHQL